MKRLRDSANFFRLSRAAGWATLVWLGMAILPQVKPATAQTPKGVLMVSWYGKDFPANVRFEKSLQKVLASAPAGSIEYYAEYIESNRFPGENQSELFHEYLRQKYADHRISVVIAMSPVALDFLLKYRDDLFPETPIVFHTLERPSVSNPVVASALTGVVVDNVVAKTLDVALRLHPTTEQVFVITGTPDRTKILEGYVREKLKDFDNRVALTYLTDLPLGELIARVKHVPARSIVFYVRDSQDELGKSLTPDDVLALVGQSADVPVYSIGNSSLGPGSIGGYMINVEACAAKVGEITLQITNGLRPQDIPVAVVPSFPMFDWRKLQRWAIAENRLPPGSIIAFRELTIWQRYRWYIVAALAIVVAQFALIISLIGEIRRRKKSQTATRELSRRLIGAQEAEQRRIARELHDGLNQRMVQLLAHLERPSASDHCTLLSDERVLGLSQEVREISAEISHMSHQLHSSALDILGVVPALRGLTRDLSLAHELTIHFTSDEELHNLSSDVALCLFRVTQESLSNVIKHSGADSAEVCLTRTGRNGPIKLTISDDGKGFDPGSLRTDSLGIISMRERVRIAGGDFKIRPNHPHGTRVEVNIPPQRKPSITTSPEQPAA